jgi:hypothetical protein
MSPDSCPWSFGQAVVGNDEGDDYRRPGVVIEESILAEALVAKHRVPFRKLKKRPRSVAAGEWTTLPAGLTTICHSGFIGLAAAVEGICAMTAATL